MFSTDCANLDEELTTVHGHQRETEEKATEQSTQIKNLLNQYNDIVSFYQECASVSVKGCAEQQLWLINNCDYNLSNLHLICSSR